MLSATRAAVLGSPIGHSLSPVLHRAAYASLGLTDWAYEAREVADVDALRSVLEESWAGLSLTMPLKRLVQPMLDVVTDLARDVGAVNTVTFGADGRVGHNTDVQGITAALADEGIDRLEPGSGCVLGAGATACSALAALASVGDRSPTVVVREVSRADDLRAAAERLDVSPRLVLWDAAAPDIATARVTVSTVPASASGSVVALVPGRACGLMLDVVYDPWPTAPARAWRRAGGSAIGGLSMLVHQAVGQVELMTGRTPSAEVLLAAGRAALQLNQRQLDPHTSTRTASARPARSTAPNG